MDRLANPLRRWLAVLIAVALGAGLFPAPARAASPMTKREILNTLKEYDPDGYYVVRSCSKAGADVRGYFAGGELTDGFDTAVHESNHTYIERGKKDLRVYAGSKKSIGVNFTSVFRSRKMAHSIPKRLRKSRWDVYIWTKEKNVASDVRGVYGLIDEFASELAKPRYKAIERKFGLKAVGKRTFAIGTGERGGLAAAV